METWRMDEARDRIREIVNRARNDGPQRLTSAMGSVVVLDADVYARLAALDVDGAAHGVERRDAPALMGLFEFMQASPLAEAIAAGEFSLERDPSPAREFGFWTCGECGASLVPPYGPLRTNTDDGEPAD